MKAQAQEISPAQALPAANGRLKQPPWYYALLLGLFLVGCFVRLYGIGTLFTGINQDEASIGYDAFAILNYGIDRNGVSLPAYLIAWGNGQNAGYAYLLMPFIKLFGLSLTTLRLPMALVGCLSMVALYTILRRSKDRRLVLLGVFLLAICPWHILKSRWALESNLLPDLLLWGIALLCAGIAGGTKRYFYLGFAVFGLSTWAYATSFLVLPLFLLPAAFVLWRRKQLSLPHIAGCFGVLVLVSWPIILFSVITVFQLPTIHTPLFTIPAMPQGRQSEVALFGPAPLQIMLSNAKRLFQITISQDDLLLLNAVQGFGVLYLVSLPLAAVGLLRCLLPRGRGGKYRGIVPGSWLFLPLLAAALVLGVMIPGNINRVNALWMPLIWFWILGAYELLCIDKLWQKVVPAVYTVLFILYCNMLFGEHMRQINLSNQAGLLEAVRYADTLQTDVYVESVHETYIRILFATQMPPQEYIDAPKEIEPGEYPKVLWFGKWHCYALPDEEPENEYVAIVATEQAVAYAEKGFSLIPFGNFTVVIPPG